VDTASLPLSPESNRSASTFPASTPGTQETSEKEGEIYWTDRGPGEAPSPPGEQASESEEENDTLLWSTYASSAYGFSLEYPADWKAVQELNKGYARLKFQAPMTDVSALVDISSQASSGGSRGEWERMSQRLERAYGSRYQLLGIEDSRLDSQEAATWTFLLTRKDGVTLRKIDIGTTYAGRGYALLCQAPVEVFDQWQPAFTRIISSFRFQ